MACTTWLALLIWTAAASGPETEKQLHDAVSLTPTDAKAHLDLVDWHMTINDTDKALGALKHAIQVDPDRTWRYQQRAGDIHYDHRHNLVAAEASYLAAFRGNPRARRSLLRYGELRIWGGKRDEADTLFEDAVKAGLLKHPHQRPLDTFLTELSSDTPWFNSTEYMVFDDAMETLAHPQVVEIFQNEYTASSTESGWNNALGVSHESDPKAPGRHLQFWVHRPHFVDGIWRDMCAVETPKICQALKSLNESGQVVIIRASFEILENGALARPHCHTTNGELFIDVCLRAPNETAASGSVAFTAAGGEQRSWVVGDVSAFDPSFEHVMANRAQGKPAVILRLAVQHPDAPCTGSWEQCGVKGFARGVWSTLSRMGSDALASIRGADTDPDEAEL